MDSTRTLQIDIRYFAALRETLGRESDHLSIASGATPREVWERLHGGPPPTGVLVAIDQGMARWDTPIEQNSEVAFFPPITGG